MRGCPGPCEHLAVGPGPPHPHPKQIHFHPCAPGILPFPGGVGAEENRAAGNAFLASEKGSWVPGLPRIQPPAAAHSPLQGKLRQGWSHSSSLRGGASHRSSEEWQVWDCAARFCFPQMLQADKRSSKSPIPCTGGDTEAQRLRDWAELPTHGPPAPSKAVTELG